MIKNNLCCGCGTCVGICPTNAIKFIDDNYYPVWLNKNKCTNCGFCFKTCPGKGLDLDVITKKMNESKNKYNIDIGNYHGFNVGYSTNEQIRTKSASGGIATALLLYALDKKVVDKVIVVKNDPDKIARPIYKITNSKDDILESIQSKYIQIPLNVCINEILKTDEKYGIIGLPCHLEGLYLAQQLNKKLSDQIIFKIGLFCGYSYSYECVDALLKRMNLEKKDIKFLGWREGTQYPGFLSFKLQNGKKSCLSYNDEHNITVANYALFRCFLCIDGLSQLSDISLGDTTDKKSNNTFIISRTTIGEHLLNLAKNEGYINYYKLDENKALEEGIIPFMVKEKRHKVLTVIKYLSGKGISVPQWDIKKSKINQIDKINAILRVKLVFLIRKPFIRRILLSKPKLMGMVGGYIYRIDIDFKRNLHFKIINILQRSPKLIKIGKKLFNK